jgi:carbon monoxide dehydrogenase subunit G
MAITFSGEFEVKKTPEQVYDFLTDPQKFAPLLPDYEGMSVQDPAHFTVQVKVGISHIKGTANVKMELAQAERPTRAQYKGQAAVAGGGATILAGFDLNPSETGTKVNWQGEAQVFGRLMSVAGGLLDPLAKKNIKRLIDALQAALTATAPQQLVAEAGPATEIA